jgi:hypothetical protein
VLCHVEAFHFFRLRSADRQHHVHQLEQHEADTPAVDGRGEHRSTLNQQLARVAIQETIRDTIDRLFGEHTGQQRADRSANAVRGQYVERVIERCPRTQLQREIAGDCGDAAEQDRVHRVDEAGGRRNRDETDDDGCCCADGSCLARAHHIKEGPDHQRRRRRQHRGDERQACNRTGGERAAGVESEPAEPQNAGTQKHERNVVRQQRRGAVLRALAEHHSRHDGRRRRVHVHDRAAGEIKRAPLRQPSAAPYPMRDWCVDRKHPQGDKRRVGGKAHALDNRSGNQCRGDDRECALESHEEHVWNSALRLEADAAQEGVREIANPRVAAAERQRVAEKRPDYADESE